MSKIFRLFISHSWDYGDKYKRIIEFLIDQKLTYYDHSIPEDDPIHTNGTDKQLKDAIEAKIKGTSCVIVLAGVYSSYRKWIQKEIDLAKKHNKPIIAVEHWGAEKTSQIVKQNADAIVSWNGKSIVDAIKKYGS